MNKDKNSYIFRLRPARTQYSIQTTLVAISLVSLITGCSNSVSLISAVQAQKEATATPENTATPTAIPTSTLTPTSLLPTSTPTSTPSPTPWPSPTLLPTATPWPAVAAWRPVRAWPTLPAVLPTLTPVPAAPAGAAVPGGPVPMSYAPPDNVYVAGNIVLQWEYAGELAEDEFFDIKIKPYGNPNSTFVDWSKSKSYELHPWSGWNSGLYTWQIGIVKGYLEGETKHFIADTGRDSFPLVIKWHAVGGGGDGGGNGDRSGGGGSNASGGS